MPPSSPPAIEGAPSEESSEVGVEEGWRSSFAPPREAQPHAMTARTNPAAKGRMAPCESCKRKAELYGPRAARQSCACAGRGLAHLREQADLGRRARRCARVARASLRRA